MTDFELVDWLDAVRAREIDSNLALANLTRVASLADRSGFSDWFKDLKKDWKISMYLHKIVDPDKIKKTRERLKGGRGKVSNDGLQD